MSVSSKRSRSVEDSSTVTTTTISDLQTSHALVAPNEYSSAAIGIQNCLLRCCESEHLAKSFYQGVINDRKTKDFLQRLNELEKRLNDCQLDIERSAMIARLRKYLENNEIAFEDILTEIRNHLDRSMREGPSLPPPQSYDQLLKQCSERDEAAYTHEIADRMRRFQFYDHDEVYQQVNLINLQNWTQTHFQLLVCNIKPDSPNLAQLTEALKNLLHHSFFFIQHPSPAITKAIRLNKGDDANAKLNCRLLCLLDTSKPGITIDYLPHLVRCLSKSNQMGEDNVSYRQAQMLRKTCSIVTASGASKGFSCAEMSEIILSETSIVPQTHLTPTGRRRNAPCVYYIDIHVKVTVQLPNGLGSFQHEMIVRSAPFGLITNTGQITDLFPEVFLEDLKSWKSTTTNLTIRDIADSIRRYFIHKTGIHPKHWVISYIENELSAVYKNDQNFMDTEFYDVLTKIFAQIQYMTDHPLLIFFHDDGVFFALCDSKLIHRILLQSNKFSGKAFCVVRFGSIHNMSYTREVGVRIDLADNSFTEVQQYTFETEKMSMELGLFIIKIALCEASCFESILSNFIENPSQSWQVSWKDMHAFGNAYDSKKLRELCPHEKRYPSIWTTFPNKENRKPTDSTASSMPGLLQNLSITVPAGGNKNHHSYHPLNSNTCTINQIQQVMRSPQIPHIQQPLQLQTPYPNYSNMVQSAVAASSNTPIVIVIKSSNEIPISDQDITQLLSNYFPQYSPIIQSDHIHHFDIIPLSQSLNTATPTLQNSSSSTQSISSTSEASTIDRTCTSDHINFPDDTI